MIVRIATEAQYELPEDQYERVNQLDNEIVAVVEGGDEARFRELFDQMIEVIRSSGRRLDDEELRHSDVIVPPADIDLDEARRDFTGEGLIPESLMPGS